MDLTPSCFFAYAGASAQFDIRYVAVQVKSASEWVVDKLAASQETLAKFVVFAHHKTVLDRLQEASIKKGLWLDERTRRKTFGVRGDAAKRGHDSRIRRWNVGKMAPRVCDYLLNQCRLDPS